jgi:hypothetical protein
MVVGKQLGGAQRVAAGDVAAAGLNIREYRGRQPQILGSLLALRAPANRDGGNVVDDEEEVLVCDGTCKQNVHRRLQ